MQQGKLNGQEAFMTGRLRIEGDMALMMQVAAPIRTTRSATCMRLRP
jgi:putative sterol carrier protein